VQVGANVFVFAYANCGVRQQRLRDLPQSFTAMVERDSLTIARR